ncbi:MAG: hypothetical protein EI684_06610 [Candidatus Viridilinea halotolerans]|uniref:Tetratricopeptide repeat protein n=1 Tax=Candidatus Viridilinea halotolerans TaxID=2491704 RepID=A0A426U430_9CHLR|nr:MAG: hypothetical protein EI684_06610 [Candidatus Viridilinea halotolerans]
MKPFLRKYFPPLLRLLLALITVGGAVWWLAQPDPRDALRNADRLFLAGRYHEALFAYAPLVADLPAAQMRLGMVYTLRGERSLAEEALRNAMRRGLATGDYHLALLYLGQALAADGRYELAMQTWHLLEDCRSTEACVYRAPGRVLAADAAWRAGEIARAEAGWRAALDAALPNAWAHYAQARLALLLAADRPAAALTLLATPVQTGGSTQPFTAALLPAEGQAPAQLAAILAAPSDERHQLLGQLYLAEGRYDLAEGQFAQIAPDSPHAHAALVYAAYANWRADGSDAGRARLEALVAASPQDAQARMLLALVYLSAADADAAYAQLETVEHLAGEPADREIAWASWHSARREYDQASLAYDRALVTAKAERLGDYALLAARFHLATNYELCRIGWSMAELAARERPTNAETLTIVAAHRYRCGAFADAAEAARAAQRNGAGAEAAYYEGQALAALGETAQAYQALIRAADVAPASLWRQRAEEALGYLGQ